MGRDLFKIHGWSWEPEPKASRPDCSLIYPCLSPFPILWPLAPLSFLMASPCLGLSGMRQASYNQPQGDRVAMGRRLTYEVSVPSYHIYGAVPSPVSWLGAGHYPEASGKVLDHISPQAWGPHCSGP